MEEELLLLQHQFQAAQEMDVASLLCLCSCIILCRVHYIITQRQMDEELSLLQQQFQAAQEMDEELLLLQQQFQAAQEVKAATRLSERNVVELVSKLTAMGLLGDDLLYSLNGKEYITQERLQQEVEEEVRRRGRVSLVDLGTLLNVDLFYCERAAKSILETAKAQEQPWVQLVQGELITHEYWDGVADEVDAALQESGQVAVSDLAMRFNVGAELMASILSSRLGSRIHGTMSSGQLFTGAHMARMRAAVRGAARALTEAANMADIWPSVARELGRDYGREYGDGMEAAAKGEAAGGAEGGGAGGGGVGGAGVGGGGGGKAEAVGAAEAALFARVFGECVAEGEVRGSSKGGGTGWVPEIFAQLQRQSVEAFFSQNAFITFSAVRQLGIPQPRQYLESLFPDKSSALLLDSTLVHSSLVHQLDAAVEEAIAAKSCWMLLWKRPSQPSHGGYVGGLGIAVGKTCAAAGLDTCPLLIGAPVGRCRGRGNRCKVMLDAAVEEAIAAKSWWVGVLVAGELQL
ncbi:unnamed protein product, partial [Closterium sp. Yama58-4]